MTKVKWNILVCLALGLVLFVALPVGGVGAQTITDTISGFQTPVTDALDALISLVPTMLAIVAGLGAAIIAFGMGFRFIKKMTGR